MGQFTPKRRNLSTKLHNVIYLLIFTPPPSIENIKSNLRIFFVFLFSGDLLEGYSVENKIGIISASHTGQRVLLYLSWPSRH